MLQSRDDSLPEAGVTRQTEPAAGATPTPQHVVVTIEKFGTTLRNCTAADQ